MMKQAIANYHVTSPQMQAFHIDRDGVSQGPELVPAEVNLTDLRDGGEAVTFEKDSLMFLNAPTNVQGVDQSNDWKEIYNAELNDLLIRHIGAKEVVIFDHTVRIDDETATRQPARNVHGDYSKRGAQQRLRDLLGEEKALEWEASHFAFINTWRPINHPIMTTPLGFVRPRSVAKSDWVDIDLIYPDRKGHIVGLVHNDQHEWVYLSKMTPDEIAIFNVYDNQDRPYIAHGALDMVEEGAGYTTRMSVESRVLVKYD